MNGERGAMWKPGPGPDQKENTSGQDGSWRRFTEQLTHSVGVALLFRQLCCIRGGHLETLGKDYTGISVLL